MAGDRDARAARDRMVQTQLVARGIADPRVLAAMREVPREAFVSAELQHRAFDDGPLPIGHGQTISQPYIVALTLEAARIAATDRILEVGAGSGYAAAVAGRLAMRVIAIERHAALAEAAAARLAALGIDNVEVRTADGSSGAPADAPFDAIVVAASGPRVPQSLLDQLADGGRLVMPVGMTRFGQQLIRIVRDGETFREDDLCGVMFVPLVGNEAWPEP